MTSDCSGMWDWLYLKRVRNLAKRNQKGIHHFGCLLLCSLLIVSNALHADFDCKQYLATVQSLEGF